MGMCVGRSTQVWLGRSRHALWGDEPTGRGAKERRIQNRPFFSWVHKPLDERNSLEAQQFFQMTSREFRSLFFNTQYLANPAWYRTKYAGQCSLCHEFGHRRPTCPLKTRTMDSVYLLRAPVARENQMWLQGGLSGNPPSSIDIGSGLPPPLRCIQVEELPAPVEVSLGMAESLALAPLPVEHLRGPLDGALRS
jgi:hypothetical protein